MCIYMRVCICVFVHASEEEYVYLSMIVCTFGYLCGCVYLHLNNHHHHKRLHHLPSNNITTENKYPIIGHNGGRSKLHYHHGRQQHYHRPDRHYCHLHEFTSPTNTTISITDIYMGQAFVFFSFFFFWLY